IATTCGDYLDFFLDQDGTRAVGCVIETVRDTDAFLGALAKAQAKDIPVVALKLGRTERGRHFARAHTGALTATYAIYEALFAKHGVIAVDTLDEFLDTLEMFRFGFKGSPGGIAVLTHSGGERQLIVDLAERIGAELAELTPETSNALSAVLEPGLSPENPVDAWGDGKLVGIDCLEILDRDPHVAVVSLAADLFFSAGMGYSLQMAENAALSCSKPFVVFGASAASVVPEAASRLRALRIPVLSNTENALKAMKHYTDWHRTRLGIGTARETTRLDLDLSEVLEAITIDAKLSENILTMAGIPFAASRFASTSADALNGAAQLGYPVVLKTANPAIEHKTELGGVILNLKSEDELADAYARLASTCGPDVQVQKQHSGGTEILLGMVRDDQFGPVLTVALGGVTTELFRDSVTFMPPVTRHEALQQLSRLRAFPLLTGFRGRPNADLESLSRLIERFSLLALEIGHLFSEIDINPVIATASGAVAVDALFIRDDNTRHAESIIPASKAAHG
ncbi:hypothetical protein EOA13_36400, partial [Mesorhizobium sp. M7A.F.Ca.US.011.01.1.1]|uniref:acetate--CoA ligase family protein n=1 Tax=Mesorhizobium sp. M7A.F.Ca.US.011.01.1.1 TaxID=2496741 RepID=UPI000FCB13A9